MATRLGMTDTASADTPVAIDRVDYTRNGPDGILYTRAVMAAIWSTKISMIDPSMKM